MGLHRFQTTGVLPGTDRVGASGTTQGGRFMTEYVIGIVLIAIAWATIRPRPSAKMLRAYARRG